MISYLNKSGLKIKQKLFNEINSGKLNLDDLISDLNSGVNIEEYEIDLFKDIELPTSFKQCSINDFEKINNFFEYKTAKIKFLKEIIEEDFLFYSEYIEGERRKLEGKFNEIKNKIAFLGGFKGSVINSFVENFNNMFQVDTSEEFNLTFEAENNLCLLPVVRERKAEIKDLKILNSSNGVAGNIEESTNSYPSNSLNKNENLYFEYYKKGNRKLLLNLEITLNKEEIINFVKISIKQKYLESNFKIENIVFVSQNKESKNIFDLIDSSMQNLEIKSYNATSSININCLPAKTKTIKLFLSCSNPTNIDEVPYNVISLKEIYFGSKIFEKEGEAHFKEMALENVGGSILSQEIISYPKKENLIYFSGKFILDDEEEIELNKDEKVLLEDSFSKIKYSFQLKKPEEIEDFYSENIKYDMFIPKIKQQIFNRNVIPNNISIPYAAENIEVYQPEIYERSFQKRKSRRIGYTKEEITVLELPENLNELNVRKNELQVFVDFKLCQLKTSRNLLEDLDCYTDGESVWIKDTSENKNKEVRVNLIPNIYLTHTFEGDVYFENEEFIERDLSKISIISFKKEGTHEEETFISELETIKLRKNYTCNVKIINENDEDVSEKYEINNKLGLLYLKDEYEVPGSELKVNYDFFEYKETNPKNLISENKSVKGFIVPEENLYINKYNQRLNEEYSSFEKARDLLAGEKPVDINIVRSGINALKLKTRNVLKNSLNVDIDLFGEELRPKEVKYVDGKTEFLNLTFVEREIAPLIETNSLGEFSFTLNSTPSENKNLIKIFKDGNEILEPNIYSLNGRIITITTSEQDSKGYSVSYYTEVKKVSEENYAKYSVDYLNGIFYGEHAIDTNSSKIISYSSSNSLVESSVSKVLNNWEKNESSISINLSDASKCNNFVKVSWREKNNLNLQELIDFYSPIVYQIKWEIRG